MKNAIGIVESTKVEMERGKSFGYGALAGGHRGAQTPTREEGPCA